MTSSPFAPVQIVPDGIYDDGAVRVLLDVSSATLRRARRDESLRYRREGTRVFYLGQWILDWLGRPHAHTADVDASRSVEPAQSGQGGTDVS